MPLLDDYLTTEQLADELGMHAQTIIRWRLQRVGPPVTRIGKKVMYRRASVEAWLLAQEQRSTARSVPDPVKPRLPRKR